MYDGYAAKYEFRFTSWISISTFLPFSVYLHQPNLAFAHFLTNDERMKSDGT